MLDYFLQHEVLANSYWEWASAALVTLSCILAALLARRLIRRQHERAETTPRHELMEIPLLVASKTMLFTILTLSLACGLAMLELPPQLRRVRASVATTVLFVQLGVWITTGLVALLERRRKSALEHDRAAVGSLGIIGFLLRGVVWVLVLLLTLENLGIDVTALVAGLGVGGIAVALAVQNVLGDLFASLSITLDKPFVVGDFLILGEYLGTVEHIGIKSVRIRSLSGEQIIVANADLLGSRVRNYGRMVERRVVSTLRVPYETPRALLQKIPGFIRQAVEKEEGTRFDRSHLARFAEFALEYETVYYVLSPDYNKYMDIQQRIFFAIHADFEREGIAFAVPTRKLWLSSLDDEADEQDSGEAPLPRAEAKNARR